MCLIKTQCNNKGTEQYKPKLCYKVERVQNFKHSETWTSHLNSQAGVVENYVEKQLK